MNFQNLTPTWTDNLFSLCVPPDRYRRGGYLSVFKGEGFLLWLYHRFSNICDAMLRRYHICSVCFISFRGGIFVLQRKGRWIDLPRSRKEGTQCEVPQLLEKNIFSIHESRLIKMWEGGLGGGISVIQILLHILYSTWQTHYSKDIFSPTAKAFVKMYTHKVRWVLEITLSNLGISIQLWKPLFNPFSAQP